MSNLLFSQKIFESYKKRDLAKFNALLKKNPEFLNDTNYEGSPILHVVTRNSSTNFIKACIANNADVNRKDKSGITPLMYAARNGSLINAELLVTKGSDLRIKDNLGQSVLFYSLENEQVFEYLVNKGADINAQDYSGLSVLMHAIDKGYTTIALYLAGKSEININLKDNYERTALFYAVDALDMRVTQSLIMKGANINDRSNLGFSPLIYASIHGSLPIATYLIENNADINTLDKIGRAHV